MSQRILIVGVSESGKTTLCNRLISKIAVPVFIHDPIGADWTRASGRFETSDELKQLIAPLEKQPCVVVVDEAGEFFHVGLKHNHWIFTRGRHYAILPIAIGQRLKMMAPNVRDQASDLYVFETGVEDCKTLAAGYNCDDLLSAHELSQGEYFHVRRDKESGQRICTTHALW